MLHLKTWKPCIRYHKHYVSLLGAQIDALVGHPITPKADVGIVSELHQSLRIARDETASPHFTVINKMELTSLLLENPQYSVHSILSHLEQSISIYDVPVPLGVGFVENLSGNQAYYVACSWPAGQAVRHSLGLAPHHFHITLGFHPNDVHDVQKDISTVIRPQAPTFLLPYVQHYLSMGEDLSIETFKRYFYLNAANEIAHFAQSSSIGNQVKDDNHSDETSSFHNATTSIHHIYLDLDGVLADFDNGVKSLTGQSPDDIKVSKMWRAIHQYSDGQNNGFFESLNWQKGGKALWHALMPWGESGRLSLLTGLPYGGHSWAAGQKRNWCGHRLRNECGGSYNEVICCMSREKFQYARHGALLIDDRIKNCTEWGEAGGVYIHHTSFEETFAELVKLGIVPEGAVLEDFQDIRN